MFLSIRRSKSSNSKKLKKVLLLIACGTIVIAGGASYVFNSAEPAGCSEAGCGKQQVSLDLNLDTPAAKNTSTKKEQAASNEPIRLAAQHLVDVDDENNRLLLQRDIQRGISASTKKPFNHHEDDMCVLTVKTTKSKGKHLRILDCSNHVFKRAIELGLEKINASSILKKYKFNAESPQLEVRINR